LSALRKTGFIRSEWYNATESPISKHLAKRDRTTNYATHSISSKSGVFLQLHEQVHELHCTQAHRAIDGTSAKIRPNNSIYWFSVALILQFLPLKIRYKTPWTRTPAWTRTASTLRYTSCSRKMLIFLKIS
jgi:hypothetical protein